MSITPVDSGDPNKPVITLNGQRVVNQPRGTPYVDAGATATDPHDGNLTSRIAVSGLSELDSNTVGDYMIRYNVTNSAQLAAVEVVRMVRVNVGAFAVQTGRDIGTTGAHMGYYEHLPVNYTADPTQKFPLIVYQHGCCAGRFDDYGVFKVPLTGLQQGDMVKLINDGLWDNSRPFVVLSPQRCIDAVTYASPSSRTKVFIDYAIHAYNVDPSRIYVMGYSAGSSATWDYINNYPDQIAAAVPMSGSWGTSSGCTLAQTPSWAFQAMDDPLNPQPQIDTVASINACHPVERAKLTVFPSGGHSVTEEFMTIALTGLGQGLPQYDIYDQSIYDWLLQHSRPQASPAVRVVTPPAAAATFTVTPEVVTMGRSARLMWSAPGAVSCVASGDWVGQRPAGGSERVTPPAPGSYGYVLSCVGPNGAAAQSVSLEVEALATGSPHSVE